MTSKPGVFIFPVQLKHQHHYCYKHWSHVPKCGLNTQLLTSVSCGFQPTQRLFMHFDTSDYEKGSVMKRNTSAMKVLFT